MEWASLNRCVLSLDLNRLTDVVLQRSGGSEFQSWGAERLNTVLPMVARWAGGNREVDGGRGSECASRCGNVEEVRQVWRGEVVNGLEGEQ